MSSEFTVISLQFTGLAPNYKLQTKNCKRKRPVAALKMLRVRLRIAPFNSNKAISYSKNVIHSPVC